MCLRKIFNNLVVRADQQGQVLLIVILVMVVAMTVGLSVATRSITNLRNAKDEESSQRAYSAAEAGIERAFKITPTSGVFPTVVQPNLGNSAAFNVNVQQVGLVTSYLPKNGEAISQDDGFDVWLSDYPTFSNAWSGTLTIYWGDNSGACSNAAIEVVLLTGSSSSPTMTHYGFDPCLARRTANHFTAPGAGNTVNGTTFPYSGAISVTTGIIARVIPLYADTVMGVTGSVALRGQGQLIQSTGSSGQAQRKVQVYQSYPKIPDEFFPYALFSP